MGEKVVLKNDKESEKAVEKLDSETKDASEEKTEPSKAENDGDKKEGEQ